MSRIDLGAVAKGGDATPTTPTPPVNAVKKARAKKAVVAEPGGIYDEVKPNLERKDTSEEVESDTYHDQETEFGSDDDDIGERLQQDSDVRHVLKDMIAREGIEGQTDVNQDQAGMLLSAQMYHRDYPDMGFDALSEWFSLIQLSLGRKSRGEKVDVLKGNVSLKPNDNSAPSPRGF